ncbi:MAG: hypothetical protein ACMUIS_01780 [bacterium]
MKTQKINRNKRVLLWVLVIVLFLFISDFPANALAPLYYSKYFSPYLSFYSYFPALLPFYYPTYIDPTLALSPVLTAPTTTIAPTAAASGLLFPLFPSPIVSVFPPAITPVFPTSFIAPAVADFLINTGNPQVDAVLGLIALNPLLLNDPLLLNLLINTGNPDVASALAVVSTIYAP